MGPYYSPEDYGLTIVAEVNTDEAYQFDQVVIWRDLHGALWGAHDSGCSCPTPFEDVKYPDGMMSIKTLDDVRPLLDKLSSYTDLPAVKIFDFIGKLRAALA